MKIRVASLPPALHGVINLLSGSIALNEDDPPFRQVQALLHELIHDGLARTGVRLAHADIHEAARALAHAMRARGLAVIEDPTSETS